MVTARRWYWTMVGLWVTAAVLPFLIYRSELPSVIASHWGLNGRPDGNLPVWAVVGVSVAVVALGAVIGHMMRRPAGPAPESVGSLAFMGALATGLAWLTVDANRGVADWTRAGSIGWLHVLGVLGVSLASAAVAFLWWRRTYPPEPEASSIPPPAIAVAPGETVAWTGSATVRWPLIVVALGAIAFVLVPGDLRWLMLFAPVISLFLLRVEAAVSSAGLTVRLGPIRVRRIPLERITGAEATHIEPMRWGGWGWRVIPNASAIVLRRGEGLVVHYPSGRRFAVTVDDAATGAGLLNGLLAREAAA